MGSLLRDEGFWLALVVGGVGAAAAWFLGLRKSWYAGFAFVAVVATLAGLAVDRRLPFLLAVALVLLGARSLILRTDKGPRLAGGLALLTGAALLAESLPGPVSGGTRFLVFAAALVLLPPTERVGDRTPRLVLVVLVVAVIGIFVCVPDTELLIPALGGFLGAAFVLLDPELAGWSGGTSVAGGLLLWLSAADGYGRLGSVVGGMACAAAVLLLAEFATGRREPGLPALVVPVVYIAFCARVAGLRDSGWAAALLVALAVVVAVFAQQAVGKVRPSSRR